MTAARLDAIILAWSSTFAVFEVACLLLGQSWGHALPLALHLGVLTFVVRSIRRRWRATRRLQRWARLHLRAAAWAAVLEDRATRGAPGISHARLGLFRALDLANAEGARLQA